MLILKIKSFFRRALWLLNQFGFNPVIFCRAFRGIFYFMFNYIRFCKVNPGVEIKCMPCLTDRFDSAGNIDYEYFYQDMFVANLIRRTGVLEHYDVGSRIDGFISQISLFCNVKLLDIRPLKINSDAIETICVDFSSPALSKSFVGITNSLSCLHTLEHIGLGRYGDPIDLNALHNFIKNLSNTLVTNGSLYISFPVGDERVLFDAHRIFNYKKIIELFNYHNLVVESKFLYKNQKILCSVDFSTEDWDRALSLDYALIILVLRKNA